MKYKTAELEGDNLDQAVMIAQGYERFDAPPYAGGCNGGLAFKKGDHIHCWMCCSTAFIADWDEGGPIIEREGIWLTRIKQGFWGADIPGEPGDPVKYPNPKPGEPGHVRATASGPTPLIAAMRAFVLRKLGEEIELS